MKTFDLAKIESMRAVDIYTKGGVEPIMEAITAEVRNFKPDTSTDKGRKEIASLSGKVSKAKAAMERAADTLTEEAKALVKSVNTVKKDISERCAALRDEARQPLSEYEAEQERIKELENIAAKKILDEAEAHYLNGIYDQARDQEKRQAELERKEQEMAAREAAIEAEKQKLADAENERIRLAEKAESDRLQAIEDEKRKIEQAAIDAQAEADRIERERLAEIQRKKDEEERIAAAVIKAKNDERKRNEAVAAQELAEKLKREENKRIVNRVHNQIVVSLSNVISEQDARKVVDAIAAGKVKGVSITY